MRRLQSLISSIFKHLIDIMNPDRLHQLGGSAKKTYKRKTTRFNTKRTVGYFQNKVIGEFCQKFEVKQIVCIHFDGVCSVMFESMAVDPFGFAFETESLVESEVREELASYVKTALGADSFS